MTGSRKRVTRVMAEFNSAGDRPMRKIRSFARRSGRMTDGQKKALDEHWEKYGIDYCDKQKNPQTYFNNDAPVNIEIGFGMGENLLSVAQNNPDENFIGIEVHQPAVGHVLNRANDLDLNNLRLINHDAVEIFTHQTLDYSVNSVSIFFPDPWHKSKHHKRRLVSPKFCSLLSSKIKKGGRVYMATDWQHYAEQMLEVFTHNHHFKNLSPNNTYCERMEFRPVTKFEKRGHRLGHGVWDLIFEKL